MLHSISREEFSFFKNLVIQNILEIREHIGLERSRASFLLTIGLSHHEVESMEKCMLELSLNNVKLTKEELFKQLKVITRLDERIIEILLATYKKEELFPKILEDLDLH